MRSKMTMSLIFVASLSMFAGGAARAQAQNPPAQDQQQAAGPVVRSAQPTGPVTIGASMMTPEMMRMMGQTMMSAQGPGGRGREQAGPLQMVSRLTTALDDPHARAALGISDQEADSLRKIVTDTEIFTIQSGAQIAVDSIELRELLRPDKPDKAAVMSKGDEISKATSQLISRYLEAIVSAKTILTPEQQKKLREYVDGGTVLPGPPPRP